jgi:hypothetical protein
VACALGNKAAEESPPTATAMAVPTENMTRRLCKIFTM